MVRELLQDAADPLICTVHPEGCAAAWGFTYHPKRWQGLWCVPGRYYALSCSNADEVQQITLSQDDGGSLQPGAWQGVGKVYYELCVNFASELHPFDPSTTWVAGLAKERGKGKVDLSDVQHLWVKGGSNDTLWVEAYDGVNDTRIDTGIHDVEVDLRVHFDCSDLSAVRVAITHWNGDKFERVPLGLRINMSEWATNDPVQPFFELQKESKWRQLLLVKSFTEEVRW